MTESTPGPSGPPTIYDVARVAEVSIATVSNVLNRPERVAAATRERVLEVADLLGFVPKSEFVSRARKGVGRIAVIAPFSAYPSYLRRLVGVMRGLAESHVEIVLYDQESAAVAASPVLAALPVRGHLDGVIVMGQPIDEATEARLYDREVPVVIVDAQSQRFSTVTVDDAQGGRQAAAHLLQLGHRRLGYILEGQVSDYVSQARLRLDGVAEEFRAAGGELIVISCEGSQEAARAAARHLLDRPDRPTAIMAHYDDLSLAALRTARELGLRVAEDVSVMGYDDGPAADAADLSTIRQPFEETGEVGARLLLATMTAPRHRSVTALDTALVARASTGPALAS